MNDAACAQLIFQMMPLQTKVSIPPYPLYQNMRHYLTPAAQIARLFRMNPKVGIFKPPSDWLIFCSKTFDTSTRTCVRDSKINAVACAQLIFQISTLQTKIYIYHQSKCSKTWDRKYLAPAAEMVRSFDTSQKVCVFESPLARNLSWTRNFNTFKRIFVTSHRALKGRKRKKLPFHYLYVSEQCTTINHATNHICCGWITSAMQALFAASGNCSIGCAEV